MSDHNQKDLSRLCSEKGATLVVIAVSLFMLIAFVALAIDLGYLFVGRNELQNAADAAALGATRQLGVIYQGIPPEDQVSFNVQTANEWDDEFSTDKETIINSAKNVALLNKATREGINIADANILIGKWDPDNPGPNDAFTETNLQPNAVKVKAIRDSSIAAGISTFFAGVFGIDTVTVAADAVAALSGPAWVEEGELITPFGISERFFPNDCKPVISFNPSPSSCAGWHNFFDPSDASALGNKMYELIDSDSCKFCDVDNELVNGSQWLMNNFNLQGNIDPASKNTVPTPPTSIGDDFEYIGGNVASLFNGEYLLDYDGNHGTPHKNGNPVEVKDAKNPAPMLALFDYFRYRDGDGDNTVWSATVPVYKDDADVNCTDTGSNPNTAIEIVGFAKIVVMQPNPPPATDIDVHIDCNFTVIEARGGGGTFGNVVGSIPNLVK